MNSHFNSSKTSYSDEVLHSSSLPLPVLAVEEALHLQALKRIRFLASASALLELAKVLPGLDAAVLAVEWAFLKTLLPSLLEVQDAWQHKIRSPRALLHAFRQGTWLNLLFKAFGANGSKFLALDVGTDAYTLLLPAPFDGMDLPAAFGDASIAIAAHRVLKAIR